MSEADPDILVVALLLHYLLAQVHYAGAGVEDEKVFARLHGDAGGLAPVARGGVGHHGRQAAGTPDRDADLPGAQVAGLRDLVVADDLGAGGGGGGRGLRAGRALQDGLHRVGESLHVIRLLQEKVGPELEGALFFHLVGFAGDHYDLDVL